MKSWQAGGAAGMLLALAGTAMAQPTITSLGRGVPVSLSNQTAGTYFVGGSGWSTSGISARYALTGSTLTATEIGGTGGVLNMLSSDGRYQLGTILNSPQFNGAASTAAISPPFALNPTLSSTPLAATESRAARWDSLSSTWGGMNAYPSTPNLMVYGPGSSGSTTGTFMTPFGISRNGRYAVGQGYISSYSSSAGTTVSNNTFVWRPYVWDSVSASTTVLTTPIRTGSNTWRRRTGQAYAVSDDGLVIVGVQEHNVATTPTADPDGCRPIVWRWNVGTSTYDMTYLPNGVNGSGFPYTASMSPGNMQMDPTGTIIVGRGIDNSGGAYLAKWVWNAGTLTWNPPINLGSNLATPASWLPVAVTSCGLPPTITPLSMSDDGNTVVGIANYSTCSGFMAGGFIWTAGSGVLTDWYDYLVAQGTPGVTANYGPIGDNGDPSRGLPKLGYPSAVAPDASAFVGFQGGVSVIVGASPWIVQNTGGPACVAASVVLQPAATTNFSACTSSIILNAGGSGTLPLTYQWYKDGNPLADGTQPQGSAVTGAATFQLRVNPPLTPTDAGTYYCVITGNCGSPAQSTNAIVQLDPAFPAVSNDTCATAQTVVAGTNVLGAGHAPCGAYINDPNNTASCLTAPPKADRWYAFTPSTTGNYRLETCGANFDTVLSVYDTCGGTELACNNDYITGPSTSCSSQRSRIGSITLTGGTRYLIRLAAPSTAFLSTTNLGNLSILTAPVTPPNDNCGSAIPAVAGVNAFNTTEATADPLVALTCASTAHQSRDVWYTYTSATGGRVKLSTCPQGTAPPGYSLMANTVLSVHSGPCGAEIACNDNHSPVPTGCGTQLSTINSVRLSVNTPIYIRVAGTNSTTFGAGQLNVTFFCTADVDDGSMTGTADGGVTIDDLLYYLFIFDQGLIAADVDNGTFTGTPDGGVTIDDLLYYLFRFDSGC